MNKVLVIVGPTGVGKTALSIELAKKFQGEVISGDSMQIYKGLDIGTAKIRPDEMAGVPHHLIDIREMQEQYSVAEFQKEARKKIAEITARGHLPIVVGGTGLYIQALLYDYQLGSEKDAESVGDLGLREKYTSFAEVNGNQALWKLLQERDPQAADKIHFNNQRKVVRALEVFELTGKSIMQPEQTPQKLFDYFLIGLTTERETLYQRINQRVDMMMAEGLEQEAEQLREIPFAQAARGIGYKEFLPYFEGQQSLEATIEEIKLHSRRYAKRQLTWFRNRMAPLWIDLINHPESIEALEESVKKWLEVP